MNIHNIHFEKIDIYLNCATGFLLSSDMKFLSIDNDANDKLLNKFGKYMDNKLSKKSAKSSKKSK